MIAKRKRPTDWANVSNDRRHRKMVTVTLAPETLAMLDRVRADRSRGQQIDDWAAWWKLHLPAMR